MSSNFVIKLNLNSQSSATVKFLPVKSPTVWLASVAECVGLVTEAIKQIKTQIYILSPISHCSV